MKNPVRPGALAAPSINSRSKFTGSACEQNSITVKRTARDGANGSAPKNTQIRRK